MRIGPSVGASLHWLARNLADTTDNQNVDQNVTYTIRGIYHVHIVGVERVVVTCDLRSLTVWLTSPHGAQPPVKFQPVPSATACTVFAFKHLLQGFFLAVATTENVLVYVYDARLRSFSVQTVSIFHCSVSVLIADLASDGYCRLSSSHFVLGSSNTR